MKNVALVIAATIFWLILAEVSLRLVYNPAHISMSNAIMGEPMFRYDDELGWKIIPNSKGEYSASRSINFEHNALGIRETALQPDNRKRILFLGDSFTWGFDVNQHERFTEWIKPKFPDFQIINAGINGYGTDQQWLWFKQIELSIQPDAVVLLYFGENDHVDNSTNLRHGGFYKPYFELENEHLQLKGIPVPKGERYFYAEHPTMSKLWMVRLAVSAWYKNKTVEQVYVDDPTTHILQQFSDTLRNQNIPFLMMAQSPTPAVISFTNQHQIPFLDVSNSYRYDTFGGHWTPEGHQFVADTLVGFLQQYLGDLYR